MLKGRIGGAKTLSAVFAVLAQKLTLNSSGVSKYDADVVGRATLTLAQVFSSQPNLAQLAHYA